MAAVFSFGSFGDILSLIGILNDIRQIVSDGRGSYVEYTSLAADLDAFTSSLRVLDRLQAESTNDRHPDAHISTLQAIHDCDQAMKSHTFLSTTDEDTLVSALQTSTIDCNSMDSYCTVSAADTSSDITSLHFLDSAQPQPRSANDRSRTAISRTSLEIRRVVAEVEKIANEFKASLECASIRKSRRSLGALESRAVQDSVGVVANSQESRFHEE